MRAVAWKLDYSEIKFFPLDILNHTYLVCQLNCFITIMNNKETFFFFIPLFQL